jgi:hypothetical protein
MKQRMKEARNREVKQEQIMDVLDALGVEKFTQNFSVESSKGA